MRRARWGCHVCHAHGYTATTIAAVRALEAHTNDNHRDQDQAHQRQDQAAPPTAAGSRS